MWTLPKQTRRPSGNSTGLAAEGGPWETAQIPRHNHSDHTPDIVLLSETTRQVVLLVLTFPLEDRMEDAFERKRAKYEELTSMCWSDGCDYRGWVQRLCGPVTLESTEETKDPEAAKQESHQEHQRCCREGVKMAEDQTICGLHKPLTPCAFHSMVPAQLDSAFLCSSTCSSARPNQAKQLKHRTGVVTVSLKWHPLPLPSISLSFAPFYFTGGLQCHVEDDVTEFA